MGKEQAIKVIEQELAKPDTYLFKEHRQRLMKEGVSKEHQLVKTIDILINQTVRSCAEKKIKIVQKYQQKLKAMTILTCFVGTNVYNLIRLEKQLGCKRQEALNLLVEASIFKIIVVQIDEESGQIRIARSKIRERDAGQSKDKYIKGKLVQIKSNNTRLQRQITDIVESIGGSSEKKQENTQSLIGRLRPF